MVWRSPDTWTNRWVVDLCHSLSRSVSRFAKPSNESRRVCRMIVRVFPLGRSWLSASDPSPISPALALHRTFLIVHHAVVYHARSAVIWTVDASNARRRRKSRRSPFENQPRHVEFVSPGHGWTSPGGAGRRAALRGGAETRAIELRVYAWPWLVRELRDLGHGGIWPGRLNAFPAKTRPPRVAAGATAAPLQLVECRPVSQAAVRRFPRSVSSSITNKYHQWYRISLIVLSQFGNNYGHSSIIFVWHFNLLLFALFPLPSRLDISKFFHNCLNIEDFYLRIFFLVLLLLHLLLTEVIFIKRISKSFWGRSRMQIRYWWDYWFDTDTIKIISLSTKVRADI